MGTFKLNKKAINKALEGALFDSVLLTQRKIIEITPRDPKRLPDNIKAKVTGNLKRSIAYDKTGTLSYKIGVLQDEAEYAKFLEFGTINMKPRSFLRKGIKDNRKEIVRNFQKQFKRFLGQ